LDQIEDNTKLHIYHNNPKIIFLGVCRRLVFEHIEAGCVTFSLKVEKDMCNIYSTFHGGAYGYLAGTSSLSINVDIILAASIN